MRLLATSRVTDLVVASEPAPRDLSLRAPSSGLLPLRAPLANRRRHARISALLCPALVAVVVCVLPQLDVMAESLPGQL